MAHKVFFPSSVFKCNLPNSENNNNVDCNAYYTETAVADKASLKVSSVSAFKHDRKSFLSSPILWDCVVWMSGLIM